MNWREFWSPPGKGYGLFFLKFFLFSVLAFFLWTGIRTPYNHLLRFVSMSMIRDRLPVMADRFKEERGTMEVQFRPYLDGPVPPKEKKPVVVKIFLNTLHFNIIPFLALIAASPFRSTKRLAGFLIAGSIVLFLSHLLHIYLDFKCFYFRQQAFTVNPARLSPAQLQAAGKFMWRLRALANFQGFMEQAGSMIVPAFIWMIYASQWIFRSILGQLKPGVKPSSSGSSA